MDVYTEYYLYIVRQKALDQEDPHYHDQLHYVKCTTLVWSIHYYLKLLQVFHGHCLR